LQLAKPIKAGSNIRLRVQALIQTPMADKTDTLSIIIWSRRLMIVKGNLTAAGVSTDGGVTNPSVTYKDYITDGWHDKLVGWIRPIKIQFRNCQAIPKGGQILVYETTKETSITSEYSTFEPNCRVWYPVKMQIANETLVTCYHEYNSNGMSQWIIREFERIEARTIMAFDFKVYWQKENPVAIPMGIKIYHDMNQITSLADFTLSNIEITAETTGPTLAPYAEVLPFTRYENDVYEGKKAFIEFDIC